VPELPDDENRTELIAGLHRLPDLLSILELLRMYPPKKEQRKQFEPIQKDYELILLYNLLDHYGLGSYAQSPSIAMRRVRLENFSKHDMCVDLTRSRKRRKGS